MKTLVLKTGLCLSLLIPICFTTKAQEQKVYRVGQKIENISLFDIESRKYSLKNITDKKMVVLLFISNKCRAVNQIIEDVKNIQSKYGNEIEIWAINSFNPNTNPEEGEEYMKEFVKKNKLNIPYIVDLSQSCAYMFSVKYTPTVVLLKKEEDGFKYIHSGSVNTLDMNIRNVLSGKTLQTSRPTTAACLIK